jgi:hypothetical protein
MTHRFVTSSIHALDEDIAEMVAMPLRKDLKTRYFMETVASKIGVLNDLLVMFDHENKRSMGGDATISCASSYFQGVPCYFLAHGHIEYIYVESQKFDFILSTDSAKARQRMIQSLHTAFKNLQIQRAPSNEKSFYALAGEFHQENKSLLSEYRIPLSSLVSSGLDHSKALALYDRTYYGVDDYEWQDEKKQEYLNRLW